MKKAISLLLIISLFFGSSISVYASDTSTLNKVTSNDFNTLPKEVTEKYFEDVKNAKTT